ncbi:MAG: Flp pilus assembly protein CpaB [Alphaproteobacteria bacterium]
MRLQNLFTIVALVALAALVGLVVRSLVAPAQRTATNVSRSAPVETNLPQIWVARQNLDVGSFVDQADFEARDWPQAAILPDQLKVGTVQPSDIQGAVVREKINKGEPILMAKLVRPGERGFAAAVLTPGMRAISVAVDSVSANSGLVLPGDRVDLILTQNLSGDGAAGHSHVGETIARAVRVLAVGKDMSAPQDSKDVDERPHTVTLEVTPREAEAITVAASMGDIKLALRSLSSTASDEQEDKLATSDADLSKPDRPTYANDVSHALGGMGGVAVMRGSAGSAGR